MTFAKYTNKETTSPIIVESRALEQAHALQAVIYIYIYKCCQMINRD